jgi:hypothetical protein
MSSEYKIVFIIFINKKTLIEVICGTMLVNAWCLHTKFGADTKFSILEFSEKIIDDLLTEKESLTSFSSNKKNVSLKNVTTIKRCKEYYRSLSKKTGRGNDIKSTIYFIYVGFTIGFSSRSTSSFDSVIVTR